LILFKFVKNFLSRINHLATKLPPSRNHKSRDNHKTNASKFQFLNIANDTLVFLLSGVTRCKICGRR